jgi:hypothetical protein
MSASTDAERAFSELGRSIVTTAVPPPRSTRTAASSGRLVLAASDIVIDPLRRARATPRTTLRHGLEQRGDE